MHECNHEWDEVENDKQDTSRGMSTAVVLLCIKCGENKHIEEFVAHHVVAQPTEPGEREFVVYQRQMTITRVMVKVEAETEQEALVRAREKIAAGDVYRSREIALAIESEAVEREKDLE